MVDTGKVPSRSIDSEGVKNFIELYALLRGASGTDGNDVTDAQTRYRQGHPGGDQYDWRTSQLAPDVPLGGNVSLGEDYNRGFYNANASAKLQGGSQTTDVGGPPGRGVRPVARDNQMQRVMAALQQGKKAQ